MNSSLLLNTKVFRNTENRRPAVYCIRIPAGHHNQFTLFCYPTQSTLFSTYRMHEMPPAEFKTREEACEFARNSGLKRFEVTEMG